MKPDFRSWLLDDERRNYLIQLYKKESQFDVPDWALKEMEAQGLLETSSSRRLSRQGDLLAYNIEEFRIQIEHRKMSAVVEKLNVFPGSVVLDIGCGGGQTLFALADRNPSLAVGIDPELGHLEIGRSFALNFPLKNGTFAFQQGDGNFLPFKDRSVDFLICRGALHHLRIRQALQEMARVLKPGGRIYIHALGIRAFTDSVLKSSFLGKLFAVFALLNGTFYFLTGRQISLKYKKQLVRAAFLTIKSLKLLEEKGVRINTLESVPNKSRVGYYVLVGQKS